MKEVSWKIYEKDELKPEAKGDSVLIVRQDNKGYISRSGTIRMPLERKIDRCSEPSIGLNINMLYAEPGIGSNVMAGFRGVVYEGLNHLATTTALEIDRENEKDFDGLIEKINKIVLI